MEAPKTLKELCGFIGMVNYYRNMWPHRALILAPLTSQTGAPKKGLLSIASHIDKDVKVVTNL
jgi:hypothetical protein